MTANSIYIIGLQQNSIRGTLHLNNCPSYCIHPINLDLIDKDIVDQRKLCYQFSSLNKFMIRKSF